MPEIAPELKSAYRTLPKMVLGRYSAAIVDAMAPLVMKSADMEGIESTKVAIPGPTGPRPTMHVHRRLGSTSDLPVVLWIHGGGYIVGDPKNESRWAAAFLDKIDCVVACPGYRLAPRHPFPAALDDLVAAHSWLREHGAPNGMDPNRVVIAGESAGGGLAAALAQRLHDDGVEVLGQVLVYPMIDDRTAVRDDIGRKDHFAWSNGSNYYGWSSYLGTTPGAETAPRYSVPSRRENLEGLPPAWIGVGDMDVFYDENLEYARRLQEAGVPVTIETREGAPHGFPSVAPEAQISKTFLESAIQFAADAFSSASD